MVRIVLGVTGSVAAIRTPELARALIATGAAVRVVATELALYFFDPAELPALVEGPDPGAPTEKRLPASSLHRDRDEWPGDRYRRGDPVLHIALRDWADALVIAPLDANTLAKVALGLSDTLMTCLVRAWDFARPIVLAPAMNTRMWESPVTRRHLAQLLADHGDGAASRDFALADAPAVFARHCPRIILVPPQSKRLACGDLGIGAMAELPAIVEQVGLWSDRAIGDPEVS